jgi:hypothetical protein
MEQIKPYSGWGDRADSCQQTARSIFFAGKAYSASRSETE